MIWQASRDVRVAWAARSSKSSSSSLAGGKRPARGLIPLRDVLVAANQRTAAHLGLELDLRSQRIAKLYPDS